MKGGTVCLCLGASLGGKNDGGDGEGGREGGREKSETRSPSSLFRAQTELRTRRESERTSERNRKFGPLDNHVCVSAAALATAGSSIFCENENEAEALNKLVRDEREGGGGAELEEEESPQPRLMLSHPHPSLPSSLTSPGSDREAILHGHHYDHQLCACGRGSSCRSPRGGVQQQLIPRMRPRPTRTDPSHRSGAAEEFVVAVTANYMVLRSLSLSPPSDP